MNHNRYSHCIWLRYGWWRNRPRNENFIFFRASRPSMGRTHHPIQWVPGPTNSRVSRPKHEASNCHTLPRSNQVCRCTTVPHVTNGLVPNGTSNSGQKWLTTDQNKETKRNVWGTYFARIKDPHFAAVQDDGHDCVNVHFEQWTRELIHKRMDSLPSFRPQYPCVQVTNEIRKSVIYMTNSASLLRHLVAFL